ncbi:helix-turn-helix transcriptional regulator [Halosimplex sp. TS25]|uniref:helix-turn-helix transcriptional regulator n=1 Tax=Halosimplex rarum TaxID=3396619 RepID=UPI0039E93B6A
MDGSDTDEAVTLLRRATVLSACQEAALTRRQLTERVDTSRTTIYRATVALEERGLVQKTGKGYLTTPYGRALVAATEAFLDAVEAVDRLEPLLDIVDHPDLVEHAHLFTDARVTVADASDPYRVVDRVMERLEGTTRSRGTLASVTSVQALEGATPRLEGTDSIERVFAASALEGHETTGGEAFADVVADDTVTVLVADDDAVPFSFAIDDEGVTIVGHDPATGLPTVHGESDSATARSWLETLYEQCREGARPIEFDIASERTSE